MRNYFHKLTSFDIDSKRLYDEWFSVATKHDMFARTIAYKHSDPNNTKFLQPYYLKLLINYPSELDENIDPVWVQSGDSNAGEGLISYKLDNIIKDFQGSYTEQVAKLCGEYLQKKYPVYNLTCIKYAVLAPKSFIKTHIDGSVLPRFFLSASVPIGCYMEVCGERYPLEERGALFRMLTTAPHSPINESDGYRVMMVFDVVKATE
jgi:hypothetical protein